jgi:hypothetical protein
MFKKVFNFLAIFFSISSFAFASDCSTLEGGVGSILDTDSGGLSNLELCVVGDIALTDDIILEDGAVISFDGATEDTQKTILTVEDPTSNKTITLPNASGPIDTSKAKVLDSDVEPDSTTWINIFSWDATRVELSGTYIFEGMFAGVTSATAGTDLEIRINGTTMTTGLLIYTYDEIGAGELSGWASGIASGINIDTSASVNGVLHVSGSLTVSSIGIPDILFQARVDQADAGDGFIFKTGSWMRISKVLS